MAAKFYILRFLIVLLPIVTFVELMHGEAVDMVCSDGSCLNEIASAKPFTTFQLTNAARAALIDCKIYMQQFIVPFNQIRLDNVLFNVTEIGGTITANFTNIMLKGLPSLMIQSLQADTSKMLLQFKLNFTDWDVSGSYNLTARFSDPRPVRGNDTFLITASEVRVAGNSLLEARSKDANDSLTVSGLKLSLEYGKARVKFNKLEKGRISSEITNRLIVAMARQVLQQTTPGLLAQLKGVLETCLNVRLAAVNITLQ